MAFLGQPAQKTAHVGRTELRRVALLMEDDEAPYPANVGLLGANAVMLEPDVLVELIEPYRKSISKRPSNMYGGISRIF